MSSLIIKSSLSHLPDGGLKSNYGDLIRSTVLLECIGKEFLWLTDARSIRLLQYFVDPKQIITLDNLPDTGRISSPCNIFHLNNYIGDIGASFASEGVWHGFLTDAAHQVRAANRLIAALEPYAGRMAEVSWQQALVEGTGFTWQRQDYAECRIQSRSTADVGLNWHVHPEWRSKCWPERSWQKLASLLGKTYKVSWQRGIADMDEYIRWLASCEVLVTCDTLGLHLASALRKKVVAMVGATESGEYDYQRLTFLRPDRRDCMPCNAPVCTQASPCMREISPEAVYEAVTGVLGGAHAPAGVIT